ncbi:unnamed protein product [Adineta steineri]|uniref:Uncharacterized protein n=1 Tax=Adineta steineri TaxID=433720 RepID=A0A814C4N7_9BILA|nr:unnamed protein product [Adineta steineri]CAF1488011.1 unnamed protein product [Adineta steineri]
MNKRRRAPHHRNSDLNIRISNVLAGCMEDIMFTGEPKVAESMVNVLMIEDLTSDMTSISSIQSAIQSGIEEAVTRVNEAIEEAQAEVSQILGLTTTTSPLSSEPPSTTTTSTTTVTTSATTTNAQTTTTPPLASFKCAIYENMYIQTWHHTNEASPPIKNCAGSSGNFEIVKNKFVKYTLRTSGSIIDELTLILFDEVSTKAICTVSGIDQDFGWMDCEENGINPSLIKTPTHETLTVYYAKGNFTTIVTRDIGFNVGRFVINVYQSPDLAIPSTVQGQASIYECSVVTGPHISTWRLKGNDLELNQQQGCYMPSMVTLVKNEYVYYRVKVSGSWIVESEIWLYDVTTKEHVCVLYSEDLEMKADDGDKCREHGITWESINIGTHYTMTVTYPKVDFLTTIQFDNTSQQYAAHFNIYVWQSGSLVANSIGICTQFDPECLPTTTTITTTVTTSTTTSTTRVTTSTTTTNG